MNPALRLPSLFRWLQANHPSRRALLLRERFEPASARAIGAPVVVVARSRCRLKWFRLNTIPVAERLAALRMQARAWQPFEDGVYWLALQGESGLVMACDRRRATQDLAPHLADPGRARLLPEPMLRSPMANGVRLLRCLEGFEGQAWHDGWLQSSRWWPQLPSEQEWRLFMHAGAGSGAEAAQDEPCPEVQEAAWLDRPWLALQGMEGDAGAALGLERRLVTLGALALVVCTAAVARQAWDVSQAVGRRQAEIAVLRESAAALLASRDQAMASAAQARQLAAWLTEPLPIEVIVHLHDVLGKSNVQLKEMDLTGSKLRLGLQLAPQATRSAIVRDLQSGNWFKNVAEVRAENSSGLMVLEMVLDGLRPAPRSGKPASQAAAAASDLLPDSAFSAGGRK